MMQDMDPISGAIKDFTDGNISFDDFVIEMETKGLPERIQEAHVGKLLKAVQSLMRENADSAFKLISLIQKASKGKPFSSVPWAIINFYHGKLLRDLNRLEESLSFFSSARDIMLQQGSWE